MERREGRRNRWRERGRERNETACHFYCYGITGVVTEISSDIPATEDSNIIFSVSVFSLCLCFPCGPFHALHSFQQLRIFVPCYADCKNYFSGPNHNSKKETESLWHTNLKILIILIQLLTKLYEGPFYWKGRCFFIFSLVQTTAPCIWVYLFLFSTDYYCRDFMLDITKKYKQVVTMTLL